MSEPVVCTCGVPSGCCLTCMALFDACPSQPCDEKQRNEKHRHKQRNHGEPGWTVCPPCRVRLAAIPTDIAIAYPLLYGLEVPGAHGGDGRSKNPEAPLPLVIEPLDLTWERPPPRGPIALARLGENARDQIGSVPVVATLSTWVRDWAERRELRELQDVDGWTVAHMCEWLSVRTDWACDHHDAVDEYAAEMQSLRGLLFDLVGRPEPDERPKAIPGVPCGRCRHVSLTRDHDGTVRCSWPDCMAVFSAERYEELSKAVAGAARRGQISREDIA